MWNRETKEWSRWTDTPREKQVKFWENLKSNLICATLTAFPFLMAIHWLVIGY